MNCRRVNSLLSAYVDSELTGEEMLALRAHLDVCPSCSAEHQSLRETKRLLASLALKTPRAELENLLMREAERSARPESVLERWFPVLSFRLAEWAASSESVHPTEGSGAWLRTKPLAATALLSLAGLWLASASVDGPTDLPVGAALPVYHPLPITPLRAQVVAPINAAPAFGGPLRSASFAGESGMSRAGMMGIPIPVMAVPSSFSRRYGGYNGYNAGTVLPTSLAGEELPVSPASYNPAASGGAVILLSVARDLSAVSR